MQQWTKHEGHMNDHITWPATKQEIIDACQGSDVDPEVLAEVKSTLPDGDKKYTKEEVKSLLVM